MKLSTRLYLIALLLFPVLLSGCIKEDFSDCQNSLKVYFTYEPATYARTGVEPSEVHRINLYVFDAQEPQTLRGVWVDEPVLTSDYFMTISGLPEGDYRFIAWAGIPGCYSTTPTSFIVGQTKYEDVQLLLNHTNTINNTLPLFHAQKTERVFLSRDQDVYLPLVQAYNTVNLSTERLISSDDTYRLSIYDNNGVYKFDYSFAPDGDFTYTTLCDKNSGGQLSATLNILKLAADREPIIEITNETKGTELYRENLVKLLNMANTDYERTHTFDIKLKFGLDISVNINGWQIVEDGNIILK